MVLRAAGSTERSRGNSSARILFSSTLVSTRSAGTTCPSLIGFPEGCSGSTSETNFCPKRVVGMIWTERSRSIVSAALGCRARVITAREPSWAMSLTRPTSTPWRRTSPFFGSCRPALSACSTSVVRGSNTLT